MKFKYLLLLAFSVWLVGITTSLAAPLRALDRLTTATRLIDADASQTNYQACQTQSAAVVTVYAGNETGSGSIVSPDGLVITSNHVIRERGNQPIVAATANGQQYQGRVIKIDTRNDLALLQLETQTTFPAVPLASAIQIGQPVCAIGSPYGRPGVLSEGTLSMLRENGDLQANIRLYPGNSGGPLLNPQGELIGVNKAILESPSGKNTGISFATSVQAVRKLLGSSFVTNTPTVANAPNSVPIETAPMEASPVVPDVQPSIATPSEPEWTWVAPSAPVSPPTPSPGRVTTTPQTLRTEAGRRLGMTIDIRNLVVQQVQAGSVAATGGFRAGDRLLAVNGNRITGFTALQSFLNRQPDTALFTIARGRQRTSVQVRF
ncbi:MAG: S1C family serine protease [Stenomitos rutilans HA7619-LM2]|jgi:serine protease Do|nr:S1C family serine protease [Stenomitos rutilans HA7619-LM2]